MKTSYFILTSLLVVQILACRPQPSDPSSKGRIQHIYTGVPGAELKDAGYFRYSPNGEKVEYAYFDTHEKYYYNSHDSLDRITLVDAEGKETITVTRTYNDQHRLLEVIDHARGDSAVVVERNVYDADGQLISKIRNSKYEGPTSFTYRYESGRLIEELRTPPQGEQVRIHYSYDDAGHISKADFDYLGSSATDYSVSYFYDQAGRLGNIQERKAVSGKLLYQRYWVYDTAGNLLETSCNPEDGEGCFGKVEYEYSASGDLIRETSHKWGRVATKTEYRWEVDQ